MITLETQNGYQSSQVGMTVREAQSVERSFAAAYAAQELSIQTTVGDWKADTPYETMVEDVQSLMTGDLDKDRAILASALNVVSTPKEMGAFVDGMVEGPSSPKDKLSSIIENKRKGPTALRDYLERLQTARQVLKDADYSGKSIEMREAKAEKLEELDREIEHVKELIKEQIERSALESAKAKEPMHPNAMPLYSSMALAQVA